MMMIIDHWMEINCSEKWWKEEKIKYFIMFSFLSALNHEVRLGGRDVYSVIKIEIKLPQANEK